MPEKSESPARVNDGFHDIQLGAGELKVLLEMYHDEIPNRVETNSVAFTEVLHGIVKEASNWIEQGLRSIAGEYSGLDYEPTDGQDSCQAEKPGAGA